MKPILLASAVLAATWLACGGVGQAQAPAAQPPASQASGATPAQPAAIDRQGLLLLIRQSLIALDFANKSGNYTILREISAPGFAATHDAARLSALFRTQRERNLDYSGVLIFEPQITAGPEITAEGILRFAGIFPSASSQISFELYFSAVNGQWRLFGLVADMGPPVPQAPMPAPQAEPRPAPPPRR